MISLIAAILVAPALAGAPATVAGNWTLLGQPFATFERDGGCVIEAEPCSWRVTGSTLFIAAGDESEAVPFSLSQGGRALTITVNGIPVTLERASRQTARPSAPSTTVAPAPAAAPGAPAAKMDLDDPLAKLLLSSAWCNFWFNKTTGYSGSARVQYFVDGSYQLGSKSEGYSSGAGGTFASEGRSGASGHWYVRAGQLFGTAPPTDANPRPDPTTFYPLPLVINKNSNGNPIIVADGKEYASCP